jgi:eukaryotic-like serine/threonine-protein kinase
VIEGDDWTRADALLQTALDLASPERERWLAEACAGDAALEERVMKLIQLAESDGNALRPGGALTGATVRREPSSLLEPGSRLGRYEIRELLGSGGMGRVYRALDPSLDREVAIKALAGTFRNDGASLKRFEREARLLASLSHPNIASVYGFEVVDGEPYLILEKIDGETLAQRLKRGAFSVKETLAIGIQAAEGLAGAHEKGVIHRDLKPSNVMIAAGGRVKLVDFGLAKTMRSAAGTRDSDVSTHLTASGKVVGTAPYMSPEQIHGEDVDTRTDVWAFGCLLYEMLTGRGAFRGRSVAEVLASALRDDPDWCALPATVPHELRRLMQRCLKKEPRDRLQHIGDARLELVELSAEGSSAAAPAQARRGSRAVPWLAGGLAAAALCALAVVVALSRRSPDTRSLRLSLDLPRGLRLGIDYHAPFAVSPSGDTVVLQAAEAGTERLFVRRLEELGVMPLAGTEDARGPFFSPDGRWLGFFADRKLKKVPLDGGTPLSLCEVGSNQRGASWAPDGTIVLAASQTSGLSRVPEAGGRLTPLTTLDGARGESSHRWPHVLPGGRWALFTAAVEGGTYDEARIDAVSLTSGERRAVLPNAGFARYASGHLVFVRGGQIFAVPFDPRNLATRGSPEVVMSGVRYEPQNGSAHLAVSTSGSLLYGPGVPTSPEYHLAWLDREGGLARLSGAPRMFRGPRLSPDRTRVAVVIGTSTESDLWLAEASSGTLTQLTFRLSPHRPVWTPDGREITVAAERNGAWRLLSLPADGKGAERVLLESPHRMYPDCWAPDGRRLVLQQQRPDTGWDLFVLQVDEKGRPSGPATPLTASPFQETNASMSPDGRFIVYESDELDALFQAHALSFPDGVQKLRVTTDGARWPSWDGSRIVYWDTTHHRLSAARIRQEGGRLSVEPSKPFFGSEETQPPSMSRVIINVTGARFDVDSASGRVLVLETSAASVEPALSRPVLLLGWAEGLRSRVSR